MDKIAQVQQTMDFDPWGARRNTNWAAMSSTELTNTFFKNHSVSNSVGATALTSRGFTGHEMLDEVGVIHMNGRIYDAKLGRFLQADPLIQAPYNTQSLNRYSYTINNPLNATDPSGYSFFSDIFRPTKHIIRAVFKILGPEISSALVNIGSMFCGPWAAACKAIGTYDLNRAFGASSKEARKSAAIAGASQWAFGDNSGAPTLGDATLALGLNVIAAENPELGQALMFVNGNIGSSDPSLWAQNAVGATVQYQVSRKLEQEAARHGLTLQEFNLILALNSKIGLELAGDTYDIEKKQINGFFSRRGGKLLKDGSLVGGFWDINDTFLNAQGLLDAVSLERARSGDTTPLRGHSLGAARVNNLYRQGFISGATTLSLPVFSYPAAGSRSLCAGFDPICGGDIANFLRPGKNHIDSPGYLPVHRTRSVPGYQ